MLCNKQFPNLSDLNLETLKKKLETFISYSHIWRLGTIQAGLDLGVSFNLGSCTSTQIHSETQVEEAMITWDKIFSE